MKKFLLYLLVLVFMVSFVGLIFYLTRPDETILASSETIYLNIGEESTPSYVVENKKKSTKITISSSDETVAKIEGEKIIANGRGVAVVSITLKNAKGNEQVITEKIFVGDGSCEEFPIFIRNEFDLKNIGSKYELDLFFKQTSDITLTSEFSTISGEFSGVYNGGNHKIINFKQTGTKQYTSMFETITGTVGVLTFENVQIDGEFESASVLAVTNKGLVDYVEVVGKIKNANTSGLCGGIVINNQENGQIQRCVTKLNIISSGKVIGGIAAYNNSIITSCQNGDTSLKNPINCDFEFTSLDGAVAGGIVAQNECFDENTSEDEIVNTIVSNCFSVNQVKEEKNNVYWFNGSSFVKLTQSADNSKLYLDVMDNHFIIDKTASTNKYFIDVNENGEYDDGVDSLLSIWDTTSTATTLNIKFSDNCFVGGIIGVDYSKNETPSEEENRKTSNIFGNYYLITADYDIAQRGIGNIKATTPTSTGNIYVANGLTYATVTDPDSMFVSFVISFNISGEQVNKLKSWPVSVWVLDSSYFPYLISKDQATDLLVRLSVDLPVISVSEDTIIDSADKFILFARTGVFTNPDNANKTYYIVKDLDFTGLDFVMVGSDEKPVVVNFDGTGCILSNISINSNTKYIETTSISTIEESKPENIGIFGVVKGSNLVGFNLKNCTINAISDISDAKNIGGIAGKIIESNVSECSFTSDVNSSGAYLSSINATTSAENIGSLFGLSSDTKISNSTAEIEIASLNNLSHSNKLYIGGLIGTISNNGSSEINQSAFNGKITANINTNVYSGGAVGFVSETAKINSFNGRGVSITSSYAGGIACVVKGRITNSSIRSTINAKNGAGFVCSAEDSAAIENCYCETKFTLTTADANAGMACEVSRNSHFTNCVNVNDFQNEASSSKNYARTEQKVKFEFECGGKITELNSYGTGYTYDEVILTNCFYVNRVNGQDSKDTSKTTIYLQTNKSASDFWGNHVDDKEVIILGWFNGAVGTGRLKTTGGSVTHPGIYPNGHPTWKDFGFSEKIWKNVNNYFDNATLYIA